MREYTLHREQTLGLPVDEVFAFFGDPANLEASPQPGCACAYSLLMRSGWAPAHSSANSWTAS
jgi:hypothetical protein